MAQQRKDRQTLSAQITGATGAIVWQTGSIASVVRTGPGIYEINLSPGFNMNEHQYWAPLLSAAVNVQNTNVQIVSNTLVRVRAVSLVAGVATLTDLNFDFDIERIRNAN